MHGSFAQETSFQKSISEKEIEIFKEELEFKYRLFFESVLNIIDNDNNIFSRRNAYYLINSLFENEEANISDYMDNKYAETLTIKEYGKRLFMLENILPLLDKRYKFSDSIYVKPSVKDFNKKYNDLSKKEQNEKLYQVYQGEVFFIEEIISVQKVRKDVFDAVDRNVVKKLSFEISHDQDDSYRLYITSISILDPRNRAYDYKQIKSEIRSSSKPWSDTANPEYLKEIQEEALARGITLVGEKKIDYDVLNNDKNKWYYDSPTFWDYVVPGLGHLRFGSDKVRYRDAFIHASTTLISTGLAYHFNRKSDHYYDQSLKIEDQDQRSLQLTKSEDFSKKSKVMIVTAVSSYLIDILHLTKKNNKQKSLIDKVVGSTEIILNQTPVGLLPQYSLSVRF